jgi:hypothetical protein
MKHTLNPGCPCIDCDRARFEGRATLAVVLLLTAGSILAMLFLGAP